MKNLLILTGLFVVSTNLFAQVGINTDNSLPDPSAILDVKSSSQGMLVPRMTSSQRTGISPAATGLLVYQTDTPAGFWYYTGTGWFFLGTREGGGGHVVDVDGNAYPTVKIGEQEWMQENLRVTHYRNGDPIELVEEYSGWSRPTGAYCWYNNDLAANKNLYGAVYNWPCVNDSRNLCPGGWHVAADAEWTALITYLGGTGIAGGKLKMAVLFAAPNAGATNSSGFSAAPGGLRLYDGNFSGLTERGYWWTATQDGGNAWFRTVAFNDTQVEGYSIGQDFGFSVRCVKD
ncbi:MAG: fibrobacter succinogenes major paralogous domain-containing protein [Lentimicrobium sp.]